MTEILIGSIIFVLAVLLVSCIVILFKNITYAYGDACALFTFAENLRNFSIIDRCYATVSAVENSLFTTVYNTPYVLFLNIVKWIAPKKRLRGSQLVNLFFFFLYIGSFFYLTQAICQSLLLDPYATLIICLIFTLLLSIRTKILFMCLFPQAEMINYWLFNVVLILVHEISLVQLQWHIFLLGVVCGLMVRNKGTDIVLLPVVLFYLALLRSGPSTYILYCCGLALVSFDCIFWIARGRLFSEYLYSIMANDIPKSKKREMSNYLRLLSSGCVAMWSLYRSDSLWPSLGSALIIGVLSAVYLIHMQVISASLIVIALFIPLYLIASIFVRRSNINNQNGYYFCRRQLYIIFPLLMVLNTVSFSIIWKEGQTILMAIYVIWGVCYFLYQLYRVFDYYFSDSITEQGFYTYKKEIEPFRIHLADFLHSLTEPAVIMGFYLMWGEPYNYFGYNAQKKCVSVHNPVSDDDVKKLIRLYNITHIVITPISFFVGENCSLKDKVLGPVLKDILKKEEITPELTVYKVQEAGM
jgi:hypothetical protein